MEPALIGDDISGSVHYSEVNAMVRLGQRAELEAYLRQFLRDLRAIAAKDLDLARSRFISLVSVLVASVLEIGAPPNVEKRVADAAKMASDSANGEVFAASAADFLSHMTVCATPNANRMAIRTVEKAKRLLAERFGEPLSDDVIAGHLCLSRSHFRFLFKEITGIPFKRYLTEYRLNEARRLLETSDLSVKEVVARVGYADSSSFYRAYRLHHGVAPTTHRLPSI